MALGLYISVPFCRTKCSYCNFASDVFSKAVFQRYVDRVCGDLSHAAASAEQMGGRFERAIDSIYFGGGTPTVLDIAQLERLFVTISQNFDVARDAEVTVECAPGTMSEPVIEALGRGAVSRVSLGVQSFVDQEAAAVGRLHRRETVGDDIERLRAAGISNISVDLIAGLPHQTPESWQYSLDQVIESGVGHVSVYMLEVDEDSRLGRELIAGGTRYHAHFVPDDDTVAELYISACQHLEDAGVRQYEISNFARAGLESRHNLKYWTRQPYLGFGVDAHSMLPCPADPRMSVRFSTPDSLEGYVAGGPVNRSLVDQQGAIEESFFLGLRLNRGVDLRAIAGEFGETAIRGFSSVIADLIDCGLLEREESRVRLTSHGRLLSNEVFERFIGQATAATS